MRRLATLLLSLTPLVAAPPVEVVIEAQGRLDHVGATADVPAAVEERTTVAATFVFDPAAEPLERDDETAMYAARRAALTLGENRFELEDPRLLVMRYAATPLGPAYGYILRGRTPEGWLFTASVMSDTPAAVPDFSIPSSLPSDRWPLAQDVTLRDPLAGWDAYGNGTLATVAHVPPAEESRNVPKVESMVLAETPGE